VAKNKRGRKIWRDGNWRAIFDPNELVTHKVLTNFSQSLVASTARDFAFSYMQYSGFWNLFPIVRFAQLWKKHV
jgi:hypothetical protein